MKSSYSQNLLKVRDILGSWDAVGRACGGLSGKAIMKWRDQGRPPRTEYTGETRYAVMIQNATDGKIRINDLLPNAAELKRLSQ